MSSFPRYAIISVVVMVMVYFLQKAAKKAPRQDAEGHTVVALPGFYGALGTFSCAIGLAVLLYGLLDYNPDNIGPQLLLLALFGGLGLYLVLTGYVARLTLTPEGIRQRTLFGQQHFMRWSDVQKVSYGAFSTALTISDGERQLKCYTYSMGFGALVEQLTQRLGRSRAELGIPAGL